MLADLFIRNYLAGVRSRMIALKTLCCISTDPLGCHAERFPSNSGTLSAPPTPPFPLPVPDTWKDITSAHIGKLETTCDKVTFLGVSLYRGSIFSKSVDGSFDITNIKAGEVKANN